MKTIHLLNRVLPLFILLILVLPATNLASGQSITVRGVLFFSPGCSHCKKVINEVLPPLIERYGDQLALARINVGTKDGQSLYQAAINQYAIPDDRIGVPTLIMGDLVLVGSQEIPDQLAGLIDKGLATGGFDWPSIPGLDSFLTSDPVSSSGQVNELAAAATQVPSSQLQGQTDEIPSSGFASKFTQDRTGNTIAVVVLAFMLISVIWVVVSFLRGSSSGMKRWPGWVIPALVIIGIIVAGYLSYVEISEANAICGPIGNCNAVQRSPYATLFGFLPVGILGLIGYLLIGIVWLLQRYGSENIQKILALAGWGFAWIGILFSIYLTFLEPFVIGATCAWCITSAIVITLIFLATTGPAIAAMAIEEDEDA